MSDTPVSPLERLSARLAPLRRVGRGLRDGWLIIGVTLALLIGLELAYRAQGALRRTLRGESLTPSTKGHPYEHEPWFATFDPLRPQQVAWRYDPYRGWWPLAYRAPGITVDSNGLRHAAAASGERLTPQRRVFLFGGSAAWGYSVRDEHTIAAAVEAALRDRGQDRVEVVNFGQSSYNATQEAITLLLELRAGNVPDVVVFYDGNNDVSATFQNGVAGRTLNQALAADRWRAARGGFASQVGDLARHSLLFQRLQGALGRQPVGRPVMPDAEAACVDVARYYHGLTRTVEGLAQSFDFRAVFLWQPMLATSRKPRSAWERSILEWAPGYDRMMQRCTAMVDSVMTAHQSTTYVPLHALFDADTATVFVDNWGHTTEAANAVIASRIADIILPMLKGARPPRAVTSAAGDAASLSLAPAR